MDVTLCRIRGKEEEEGKKSIGRYNGNSNAIIESMDWRDRERWTERHRWHSNKKMRRKLQSINLRYGW